MKLMGAAAHERYTNLLRLLRERDGPPTLKAMGDAAALALAEEVGDHAKAEDLRARLHLEEASP